MDYDDWVHSMQRAEPEKETANTKWRDCMNRQPTDRRFDAGTNDFLNEMACRGPVTPELITEIERRELRENLGAGVFLALMAAVIVAGWRAARRWSKVS